MAMLLFVGAAIYSIGANHLRRENLKFYAGPYLVAGALLAIFVTYLFTFDDIFSDFSRGSVTKTWEVSGGYFALGAVVSAISVATLALFGRSAIRAGGSLTKKLAEPATVVLVVIAGWLIVAHPFESSVPYVVEFNLLLLVLIFGTITLGIVNKREALVNVGIIFFVIDLSTRYIELTIDMLDTSLAFIVGGILLLGVGYGMERARRKLLVQFGITEAVNHDS
jgi:hypothetical protein